MCGTIFYRIPYSNVYTTIDHIIAVEWFCLHYGNFCQSLFDVTHFNMHCIYSRVCCYKYYMTTEKQEKKKTNEKRNSPKTVILMVFFVAVVVVVVIAIVSRCLRAYHPIEVNCNSLFLFIYLFVCLCIFSQLLFFSLWSETEKSSKIKWNDKGKLRFSFFLQIVLCEWIGWTLHYEWTKWNHIDRNVFISHFSYKKLKWAHSSTSLYHHEAYFIVFCFSSFQFNILHTNIYRFNIREQYQSIENIKSPQVSSSFYCVTA